MSEEDQLDDPLTDEHINEAIEKGATAIYNLGWASGEDFIHSKTNIGKLFTQRNADGSFSHEWEEYA